MIIDLTPIFSPIFSALSGAWYWGVYKGSSINNQADALNFTDPIPATDESKFNAVSARIGAAEPAKRWDIYKKSVAPPILKGGNPYESMVDALKRLGITAAGAKGYETQFGLSLGAPLLIA